ncbi:MAG: hypothetical protein EOM64_05520, partial [Erysipelotrichia bacterium]|nr:hypothetical protein [Erysipelotrichia bacterium]
MLSILYTQITAAAMAVRRGSGSTTSSCAVERTRIPVSGMPRSFLECMRSDASRMCTGIVNRELDGFPRNAVTYGERMYQVMHAAGARGEAEMGFPSAFKAYDALC